MYGAVCHSNHLAHRTPARRDDSEPAVPSYWFAQLPYQWL